METYPAIEKADKFVLKQKLWTEDNYETEVFAQIAYDDQGFIVRFTVIEQNPLREKSAHFEKVCEDSCVEFFVNFTPAHSEQYINFETNANGVVNVAFRSDRYHAIRLTSEDIESLQIDAEIRETYWTVTYRIDYELICKYYPEFSVSKMTYLMGNLYKCGEKTEIEHYSSYFLIDTPTPDFHRPEFFGRFEIEK